MEKMEQIIEHLTAAINGLETVIHNHQEKQTQTNKNIGQPEGDGSKNAGMANRDDGILRNERYLESKELTSLEMEFQPERQVVPKEEAAV
jgi:hypothetical protein